MTCSRSHCAGPWLCPMVLPSWGVDGGWEGDVNFRVQPGWSHSPHNLLIPLHVASLHVGHTSGPPRLWVGEVKETVL